MKTKDLVISGLACMAITTTQAQFWNRLPGGNNINAAEWLGADVLSTVPLRIETRANQPIDWYTNAIHRMRLLPTAVYPIGSFPGQVKTGSLLLSPDVANFYAQDFGYRPWMRNWVRRSRPGDLFSTPRTFTPCTNAPLSALPTTWPRTTVCTAPAWPCRNWATA